MHRPFLAASSAGRSLLDHPDLEERWEQPSVLDSMTVGELAAHLSRAVTVVVSYLSAEAAPPYRDAAGYVLALFPRADPDPRSEMGEAVRRRAREEAAVGPGEIRDAWDRAHADLEQRLDDRAMDLGIAVRGSSMRVGDYLITRMVELVIHGDDLAASLGVPAPPFERAVTDPVLACLLEVATRRHGALEVIRGLSRTERADPSVLRVF